MTEPAESRRRTRLDADVRRDQILSHARALFGERPYAAVSLAEVARRAGVTRGLVNHYFGGKRELYLAVLEGMMAVPESVMDTLPEGTLAERADAVIARFLEVAARHRGIWLVTVDVMSARPDEDTERVMRQAEDVTVARLVEALGLDPSDEKLRARIRAFGAMVRAASAEWLTHGTLGRAETQAFLVESLLVTIGAARGPAHTAAQRLRSASR